MSSDRPDDAFSWGDESDASYADPGKEALETDDDGSAAAPGAGAATVTASGADTGGAAGSRRRTAAIATTGIFGGIYLMYSVGWILSVGGLIQPSTNLLLEISYQFAEFLAIIACALWFAAPLTLTRSDQPVKRLGWLALGALVLVPWPFLLGVLG